MLAGPARARRRSRHQGHRAGLQAAGAGGRAASARRGRARCRQAGGRDLPRRRRRQRSRAAAASTLAGARSTDAALAAVALARGAKPTATRQLAARSRRRAAASAPGQRYVRGALQRRHVLLRGAAAARQARSASVWSNTPVARQRRRSTTSGAAASTRMIDLGDDEFTRGRPHPMIDHRCATSASLREAADPATAVILLDVVLGYGAHPDPTAELARGRSARPARPRNAVATSPSSAHVCGTDGDPQNLRRQAAALRGGRRAARRRAMRRRPAGRLPRQPGWRAAEGATDDTNCSPSELQRRQRRPSRSFAEAIAQRRRRRRVQRRLARRPRAGDRDAGADAGAS